jgi:hypothetical protein
VAEGAFVRDYDTAGNLVWTSQYSNSTVVFSSVYASVSGIFILYAAISRTQNLGPFLMKYSLGGSEIWSDLVPSGGGISGDSTGVYIAGSSLYKYDFNGNREWATQINSPDDSAITGDEVSVDSSGVFVSASTYRGNSYLFKYDLSGGQIWTLGLPPSREDSDSAAQAYRLAGGPDGVYVAGSVVSGGSPWAMIERLSPDASLIFFGLNPPWSFILLGGLISVGVAGIYYFRRIQLQQRRPQRVGSAARSLPARD